MGATLTYSKTVQAKTSNISEVRNFVAQYADSENFGKKQIEDIKLAVDEAFTNIVKHAYKFDETQQVKIDLKITDNELCVILNDEGQSFDTSSYREPNVPELIKMKKRGGMGVYLIKKLMDDVSYSSDKRKNQIIMCKYR